MTGINPLRHVCEFCGETPAAVFLVVDSRDGEDYTTCEGCTLLAYEPRWVRIVEMGGPGYSGGAA